MKTLMISVMVGGLILALTACGESAQAQVAAEQLKVAAQEQAMREALHQNLKKVAAEPLPEVRNVAPIRWSSVAKAPKKSD